MRRDVEGILLLDKPSGISSNQALQKVKRLFLANKAGHTGSLDPLASGMLPICFGEAAKFSRFFLDQKKSYQTVLKLGITTTTGDSEGEILSHKPGVQVSLTQVEEALMHFQGPQQQIPPMFSALKQQGQRLYHLARQGKMVPRAPRAIEIEYLSCDQLVETQEGVFLTLTVTCSKGTYIRTLGEDLGNYLGWGAHVVALRRLWVAPFAALESQNLALLQSTPLENLTGHLISVDQALSCVLPTVTVSPQQGRALRYGQSIPAALPAPGWVLLQVENTGFLGVGEQLVDGGIVPRRLLKETQAAIEIS